MKTKRIFRPKVTLIIPCYNEEERFESGFIAGIQYLKSQRFTWEMLLIDDGSRVPVTRLVVGVMKRHQAEFRRNLPVFVYRLPANTGKGAAIRLGVAKSRGEYIVFSDIDLSVPIENIVPLVGFLKKYGMVLASRRTSTSKIVVHQAPVREVAGRIFTALSNRICRTDVSDVTCGFKGYRRDVAKMLFLKSRIDRWVFDTEIVYLARKFGISIYEMPVDWSNKAGSKVKPGDSLQSFIDLIRIRCTNYE
jgi:dolichyl-phosphate beta-glucosyltransferase